MGRLILIDVAVAAFAVLIWYVCMAAYNRRRATAVLDWVQAACLGKGRVLEPKWQAGNSLLKATVRLSSRWFQDARVTVRLRPRAYPVQWLLSRWRKQEETLTFEADMGFPPGFHLDVIRHRWSGHTSSGRKSDKNSRANTWSVTRPAPVVFTTKEDWPPELTPVVKALTSWRDRELLWVRFNQTPPHFTATVPLDSLSDQTAAAGLLGLFRELAASSSAKQH